MPRKYPVEIRLFAIQTKEEGHSWEKVAELIQQKFGIQPPTRRQMCKWGTGKEAIDNAMLERAQMDAEAAKVQALADIAEGLLPHLWRAKDAGEDIEYAGWKWFFSIQEKAMGSEKFKRFLQRYLSEREGQPDVSPAPFIKTSERRPK